MKRWWLLLIASLAVAFFLFRSDAGASRQGKFNSFLKDVHSGFEHRHKYLNLRDPQ